MDVSQNREIQVYKNVQMRGITTSNIGVQYRVSFELDVAVNWESPSIAAELFVLFFFFHSFSLDFFSSFFFFAEFLVFFFFLRNFLSLLFFACVCVCVCVFVVFGFFLFWFLIAFLKS